MTLTDLTVRKVVVATMYGKERAFGPVLAKRLGWDLVVPDGFDTDALGTFTGEVPRSGTIEETAIAKARLGAAETGLSLAIASEGAYGPHPHFPFLGAGLEIAVLLDTHTGRVIREHILDERPVYDHITYGSQTELDSFLDRIRFPQQTVILRNQGKTDKIFKGIQDRDSLGTALIALSKSSAGETILIQTDMPAHLNPRRMESLGLLAEKLADRLTCKCPACDAAGFGLTDTRKGLRCAGCGHPTRLAVGEIWSCTVCSHLSHQPRRDGLAEADPGQCERCNP
ncbi:hypothetical protein SAMN05444339_1184 [Loktanella atrilutea]|uniref:DUF6671 domain-containing protein n=1 Tax=Loktanella atrilutea TaxID=366533 RepID=A0A1M5F7W6_LOKAT|nr:DUF6671 family protein [Loktanella atrilutea]SHF87634.1 hypothetical protein SAMN05444339_1184 [Loktanella atrilutea]